MSAIAAPSIRPIHTPDKYHVQPAHMASASESPTTQRKNRAPRQRQAQGEYQRDAEVQSESNTVTTQTPKARRNHNRPASGNEAPNPRNNTKPQRTKQVSTNNDAPPQLATPAKNLAYASAAFHHSPAASSLPMPKFMSRSVPAPAANNTMQARLDHEPENAAPSPSPPAAATPDPLAREKSPLDMFFNADRQERASKQTLTTASGANQSPFLPNRTPPETNKDLFNLELDNNSSSPAALRSARPTLAPRISSAPGNVPRRLQGDSSTADATRSLKEFLNLPLEQPSPYQPTQTASPGPVYQPQNPFVNTTPQQQQYQQQQQRTPGHYDNSLHYGNRNLSPLFQAARTPNGSIATGPADSPLQNRNAINHPQPFDPRAYLDQQVRSSTVNSRSSFSPTQNQYDPSVNPFNSRPSSLAYSAQSSVPAYAMSPNHTSDNSHTTAPAQRRPPDNPPESSDIKEMEAKLRNILKLGL